MVIDRGRTFTLSEMQGLCGLVYRLDVKCGHASCTAINSSTSIQKGGSKRSIQVEGWRLKRIGFEKIWLCPQHASMRTYDELNQLALF